MKTPTLQEVKWLNEHITKWHKRFDWLFKSREAFYEALTVEIHHYCNKNMMEMNNFRSIWTTWYELYAEDNTWYTKFHSLHTVKDTPTWIAKVREVIKKAFWVYVPTQESNQERYFKELDSLAVEWKIPVESVKSAFTSWKYKIKKWDNFKTIRYWFAC